MNKENKSLIRMALLMLPLVLVVLLSACESNSDDNDTNKGGGELPSVSGYPVVDTGQEKHYNNSSEISAPSPGSNFYGQDAAYIGNQPNYVDNKDGTITDMVTGLMWQQDPGNKMTYDEARSGASKFDLGGYNDWRLPSIKELYSLIMFNGKDPSGYTGTSTTNLIPFINTTYFKMQYGNAADGDRIIDSQFATTTLDVGDTNFGGGNLMFGVNFADGRIKGYPTGAMPGQSTGKSFFVLYVRGNTDYGKNSFTDNGDKTITDSATKLMWSKNDSGTAIKWEDALSYAENADVAGHTDWRLPNIKELQSIVDYTRAPGTTNSAAIDAKFNCTQITNEGGQPDYGFYWSGTTHENMQNGSNAAYVSFGRALGYFNSKWMDVHGSGAQRSDPKTGNAANYPQGHGPQGDAIRILNYVRLVRDVK